MLKRTPEAFHIFGAITHLLLRNVDGLVEHYPSDGLMAGGRCGGAVVGHVVIRVGHQAAYREALDEGLVAAIADAFQLIGQHAQLRIGQIAQLQNRCESEKATSRKARERELTYLQQNGDADNALGTIQGIREICIQL